MLGIAISVLTGNGDLAGAVGSTVMFSAVIGHLGPYAGGFAVVAASVGPLAIVVQQLDRAGKQRLARQGLTLLLPLIWILAAKIVPWLKVKDQGTAIFLLFIVFPLTNAVFDFFSYAVTLALIKFGLKQGMPVPFAIMDFIIAFILFLGSGATLVVVVTGLNQIAGVPILDMGAVFGGIKERPGEYWWVYTMVFSSALPTAVHFGVSLIGFQGWVFKGWREPLAKRLEVGGTGEGGLILLAVWLSGIWFLPLVLVGLAGAGVWWLGANHAAAVVGLWYYEALFGLAAWVGSF